MAWHPSARRCRLRQRADARAGPQAGGPPVIGPVARLGGALQRGASATRNTGTRFMRSSQAGWRR
jgi:hypothetical protein